MNSIRFENKQYQLDVSPGDEMATLLQRIQIERVRRKMAGHEDLFFHRRPEICEFGLLDRHIQVLQTVDLIEPSRQWHVDQHGYAIMGSWGWIPTDLIEVVLNACEACPAGHVVRVQGGSAAVFPPIQGDA